MQPFSYEAADLFKWIADGEEIFVLDVRNEKEFQRFQVEGPRSFEMVNVSYYDFMETEEQAVSKVPKGKAIRIVCAKEGSARYVADILVKHGFQDVGYLKGGIKSWGNLMVPNLVASGGKGYELYQFIRPGKASCSYGLLYQGEMMVFDPSRAVDFYMEFAKGRGCRIIFTIETHLQADYISGSRKLSEQHGALFLGNDGDFATSKNKYRSLVDGQILTFGSDGGPGVEVVFTPGHTPGSTSFIIDDKYMISGDMVFITSIGRPDLGGMAEEWSKMLFSSMKKVLTLNRDLLILPGHYMDWEEARDDLVFAMPLGEIIERNSHIYGIDTEEAFFEFIKANMRPQPPEYALIRKANANLEQFDPEREEELDLGKNECAATAYAAIKAAQSSSH